MKNKSLKFEEKNFGKKSAEYIESLLENALSDKKEGSVYIALSGGNTPIPILQELKNAKLDWKRCVFFMVDERCVSINNSESNFRNLFDNFFKYIESDFYQIVHANQEYKEAALLYNEKIKTVIAGNEMMPEFDLILLGMGDDGHTASLFPNTTALEVNDSVAVFNKLSNGLIDRITLTYPVILNAKRIEIIVKGDRKKEIIDEIYKGGGMHYPIYKIVKNHKNLEWIVNE